MPQSGPARESLARHGGIIIAASRDEAAALANRAAPEHLVCDDDRFASAVGAAGAIFVGPYTAQVAGDYAIGSNHVLPTNGAARFRGGLHTADFVRVSTIQRMTRQGLANLAPTVITLAREEGLEAHARSIEIRLSGVTVTYAVRPIAQVRCGCTSTKTPAAARRPCIDAIRQISAEEVAVYPDYSVLSRECAAYLGVSEAQLRAHQRPRRGAARAHGQRVPRDAELARASGSDRARAGVRDVLGVREGGRRPRGVRFAESGLCVSAREACARPSAIARASSF